MNKQGDGMLITIEGGEGAGKSTLILQLEEALKGCSREVVITREPGGSLLGEELRNWLLAHEVSFRIDPKAELLLFLAARAQHIAERIRPALEQGKVVLSDRFNDSTVAYQGAGRNLGLSWVRSLCDMVCGDIVPQLTFYLDVPPEIGFKRKAFLDGGKLDRIEGELREFHEKVRQAFLDMAKEDPSRFIVLDATLPQHEVRREALARLALML